VVLTQDWHPPGHASFASSHAGRKPFEVVELSYGPQVLWPDHCVAGTRGAEFHPAFDTTRAQLVLRKGTNPAVDSYSALVEADRRSRTGLDGWLASRGIRHLVIGGLATDYCVLWSALDARAAGLSVTVVEEACRGIDLDGSLARAWAEMATAGVRRLPRWG
jgi:nicotinamidase/pyrazinamidase